MGLVTDATIGGYRVEDVLGRGGMATVYRARHPDHDRPVALKLLDAGASADPALVARFRREGRLQATLRHPHVVRVYEAGESEHGWFLAMQLVDGPTLARLIADRQLSAGRAIALLAQVADALDAAHAVGLVHRDVKPQNVLVDRDDQAYLGDFGLVRRAAAATRTLEGRLAGTVAYLAPEVVQGAEAGPAADRYAFAASAFECLAGSRVFPRTSEGATLYAHSSEPPPPISRRRRELPTGLDRLFEAALAKDPAARPASASSFAAAVRAALEDAGALDLAPPPPLELDTDDGVTAEPIARVSAPPPPGRPAPPGRSRLLAAALAGAVAASLAAVLIARSADDGTTAPVPAVLPGTTVLGSDLARPGRPLDCRGPRAAQGDCTVVQTQLPGRRLVVPAAGVIRRWALRSGRGELALQVLRPRAGKTFQIARSRNEFVEGDGVQVFDVDLAVEPGDVLGLHAVDGSAVGARSGVAGAATERWVPRLGPERVPDLRAGSGFDHELLLRVELVPGGEPRQPPQVAGSAAASLPRGTTRARRTLRFADGSPVTVELVRLGNRLVLDMVFRGRRSARIDVPGFRPQGGRLLKFEVAPEEAERQTLGVYLEHLNRESTRVRQHYYTGVPGRFTFFS